MPPVLDPAKSEVDGLAFLGLSLQRKSAKGHPDSDTHQTAFDLNDVLDREYRYLFSSNDDGWLVGGGEPGPPVSYKLAAKDSAHVEIMRIGTYNPSWGGVTVEDIVEAISAGRILIPEIAVVPTAVVANGDVPPELEIRFDMEPPVPDFDDTNDDDNRDDNDKETARTPLPLNWQLRFLHNQLFRYFSFPSRFCPGAFHSTILRKAEFRSSLHEEDYFDKCREACKAWKAAGPKSLVPHNVDERSVQKIKCNLPKRSFGGEGGEEEPCWSERYQSGIWLFTDRENITHHFAPNFLPPYDTAAKRKIILDFLRQEWDQESLSWKPAGYALLQKGAPPPHHHHHPHPRPPSPPPKPAPHIIVMVEEKKDEDDDEEEDQLVLQVEKQNNKASKELTTTSTDATMPTSTTSKKNNSMGELQAVIGNFFSKVCGVNS